MSDTPTLQPPWHSTPIPIPPVPAAGNDADEKRATAVQQFTAAKALAKAKAAAGPIIVQEGSSKTAKLIPYALLANAERDELHNEIYTYFKWLEQSIVFAKSSKIAVRAGMSITSIRGVLDSLETGLKSVKQDGVVLNKVAEEFVSRSKAPFLERHCHEELKKRVEETKVSDYQLVGRFTKSWEERYDDLMKHKHVMNKWSYEEMNAKASGLGNWLMKQRMLYSQGDEKFMKDKAPMLNLIAGFQWKATPRIAKKKAKAPKAKKQLPKGAPQLPRSPYLYHPAASFPSLYERGRHPLYPYKPGPPGPIQKATTKISTPSTTLVQQSNNSSPPQNSAAAAKPYKYKPRPAGTGGFFDFDTEFNKLLEHQKEHGNLDPPSRTRVWRWCHSLRQKWIEMGGDNMDAGNTPESNDDADATGINALATAATANNVDTRRIVSVQAPPGRLGLGVQFVKEREEEEACAVLTVVYDNCSFKDKVKIDDCIVTIENTKVTTPEDLSIAADKTRTIVIRKKRALTRIRLNVNPGLTQEQIQRLNSIGFRWEGSRTFRPWEDSFGDLMTYYQTYGDFLVPRTYKTPYSFDLGNWTHRQRFNYSKKVPNFMKDFAPQLEAVGFSWKPRKNYFETRFKELVDYKRIHGHVDVPVNNSRNNEYRTLGRWAGSLRYTKMRLEAKVQNDIAVDEKKSQWGGHDNNYLTKDKIKLLDSIGFDWSGTPMKKYRRKKASVDEESKEEEEVQWE